jgi:hypothetical protein
MGVGVFVVYCLVCVALLWRFPSIPEGWMDGVDCEYSRSVLSPVTHVYREDDVLTLTQMYAPESPAMAVIACSKPTLKSFR